MPGVDAAITRRAAPISMWTIPLAVLSVQEGGGLETFTVTVLPVGEFSVPEMHVLWQPAAQSKQAGIRRKLGDVRESRR